MKSKLDRIRAILDEQDEQPEWLDISDEVKAEVDYTNDHILIDLFHKQEHIGIFDLAGFSFMDGMEKCFKAETNFVSGSTHDNGGRITWFKVYKKEVE